MLDFTGSPIVCLGNSCTIPLRAIVLDRDGTLIEHVPYLRDPTEVRLLPGVRESLAAALAADVRLFLHSNQSGVGRGWFSMEEVHTCNRRLIELLDLGNAPFTRICIAPEAPEAPSQYRKPSPEFAQEIQRDFSWRPDEIAYVGDRGSDLATAASAGTRGVGVATGLDDLRAELRDLGLDQEFPVFDSFSGAIDHLLHPS